MKKLLFIFTIVAASTASAQSLCTGPNCPCIRDFTGECIANNDPCFPYFPIARDKDGNVAECSPFVSWDRESSEAHYVGAYQTIKQLRALVEQCRRTKGRRCK